MVLFWGGLELEGFLGSRHITTTYCVDGWGTGSTSLME